MGESVNGYEDFIKAKVAAAPDLGFSVGGECPAYLFPFQWDIVRWAVKKGRAAIFAAFGMGKTRIQLEIARRVCEHTGGRFLIVAPLGVRQEFKRDADAMGLPLAFIRRIDECANTGVYVTNYETVRDGKLDPQEFDGVSLDEASCLRGFGGTKTFREFMATMAGDDRRDMAQRIKRDGIRFRFVATATPSPNEFIELLAYSAFLDVMDVGTAKTRFFQRDSEHADNLTIHPHKVTEFWRWISSWAVFVTRPSDISADYSDAGYDLPEMRVVWHEVPTDHAKRSSFDEKTAKRGREKAHDGAQKKMFVDAAEGITAAAREARDSVDDRIAKLMEIRAAEPGKHRVIWHDREDERKAIERAIPGIATVYGSMTDLDEREAVITDFADGRVAELAAKPVMLGSGCNFQRHCAEAVFLGLSYKFNDFIQAVHRIYRFLQREAVTIHIIYTEAQREIRRALETKWASHNELVAQMTAIVREHGLGAIDIAPLRDKLTCERREASGERWRLINNDSVDECATMEEGSVGLILTSIPFSTQYKYSPSYRDMGHTDTNDHFWAQMGYLTPSLLRALKPGRIFACHVKDRIVPGGMNGLGFQTVYPFHCAAIEHYTRAGFAYMGMITIVTDVVRENAQTYRLGWSEQCKDGTKQGVGMPEYLLLFRKPPTSTESAAADEPVVKSKGAYTRGRWQVDAHAFHRSSGNRLLTADDLIGLDASEIFQLFAKWSRENVYDHETHVALCDALDKKGKLPPSFMLLQPQSPGAYAENVWTDIARMRTMNTLQAAQDRVQHLCPMQFDVADRIITRFSMAGETVLDPFSGLGTVAHQAVKHERRGIGVELSPVYFDESVRYLRALEKQRSTPTLFDLDAIAPASQE